MKRHQSGFIQEIAEQLREVMDGSGATFEQMQRALMHACSSEGGLSAWEATTAPLRIHWSAEAAVDSASEAAVPARAALDVWQRTFSQGPSQPNGEQPCVFEVVDVANGRSVRIDLALPAYRGLFLDHP